jgi:hypothetical protein
MVAGDTEKKERYLKCIKMRNKNYPSNDCIEIKTKM